MSCCDGSKQTQALMVLVVFRPTPTTRFQLKVKLKGRNGRWRGRNGDLYDFGSTIGCGGQQPLGKAEVSMKFDLICVGEAPHIISGTVDLNVASTINRFTLPSVVLNCPTGGPKCDAEWADLFFGERLGIASISITNAKV